MTGQPRRRVLILDAGGRDFHVFNTRYRHDPTTEPGLAAIVKRRLGL